MQTVGLNIPGLTVVTIVGVNDDGQPVVRVGTGEGREAVARTVWMRDRPDWGACRGLRAVVGFEEGHGEQPILLGLLDAPPAGDPLSVERSTGRPEVLRLESEKELVLECGKAKVVLRADGRVSILGGYVVSRSSGVNKIKGG